MRSLRSALAALPLVLLAASPLAAETVLSGRERVDFSRPEAWGMKFAAAAVAFGGLDAPRDLARGAVELALAGGTVPALSAAERRIGFDGTKEEAIDRARVVGQLRAAIGLGRGFAVELVAVPPVALDGLEPRVAGAALLARRALGERWRAGARLGWDHGTMRGDITCSRSDVAAGADPAANPFGCTSPSDDRYRFDLVSLELVVSRRQADPRHPEPYLALAAHRLDGEFAIRADYRGIVDRTRLAARGTFGSAALGAAAGLGHGLRLAAEIRGAALAVRRPGRPERLEPATSLRVVLGKRLH